MRLIENQRAVLEFTIHLGRYRFSVDHCCLRFFFISSYEIHSVASRVSFVYLTPCVATFIYNLYSCVCVCDRARLLFAGYLVTCYTFSVNRPGKSCGFQYPGRSINLIIILCINMICSKFAYMLSILLLFFLLDILTLVCMFITCILKRIYNH